MGSAQVGIRRTGVSMLALVVVTAIASQVAPLHKVESIPLPGRNTRFDYESLDPTTGRLYVAHLGEGTVVVFDTRSKKVIANLPGLPAVHGVLAVPEEGKLYATATRNHQVVVLD